MTDRNKLISLMQRCVEEVESKFSSPDDDWPPVVAITNSKLELDIICLAPLDKQYWCSTILTILKQTNDITAICTVNSCWEAKYSRAEMLGFGLGGNIPRPAEHSNRREAVMLCGIDSLGVTESTAQINRKVDVPPTLGVWENLGTCETSLWQPIIDYFQETK